MDSCETTTPLSGLHLNAPWLEAKVHPLGLFSCQRCKTSTEIPVIFMGTGPDYYGAAADVFTLFRTSFVKTGLANIRMSLDDAAAAFTNMNQPSDSYQT